MKGLIEKVRQKIPKNAKTNYKLYRFFRNKLGLFAIVFVSLCVFFIPLSLKIYSFEKNDNTESIPYVTSTSTSNNTNKKQDTEHTETADIATLDMLFLNNRVKSASDGTKYHTIATLYIPSLKVKYPILSSTTTELLNISLNKYWGADPNQPGNMCIVGHNYRDNTPTFFSNLHHIKKGEIIKITDLTGKTLDYKVYKTYVVEPTDTRCTSQATNGKTEITLITCYNQGTQRFIVKARV